MLKNIREGLQCKSTLMELTVMAVIYYHWCIAAMALKTVIEKKPGACAFDADDIYKQHLETLVELGSFQPQ